MSELSDADRIWNRATSPDAAIDPTLGPADRALAAMLLAHGLAMNGGVWHSVEALEEDQLDAAAAGFRYFGFEPVADLLLDAKPRIARAEEGPLEQQEALEEELEDAYYRLIPTDQTLADAFEERLRADPAAFAAI